MLLAIFFLSLSRLFPIFFDSIRFCLSLSLLVCSKFGFLQLVSHDEHLISLVCDELWVLDHSTVTRFDGTFAQYKRNLLRNI